MVSQGARPVTLGLSSAERTTALAADFAEELGAVGERVFDVTQSHMKRMPSECQLKVGQMGVQLFAGPEVRASWMYSVLLKYEYNKRVKSLTLFVRSAGGQSPRAGASSSSRSERVAFGVADDAVGLAIVSLMEEHCSEMAKALKAAEERSTSEKTEKERQRMQLLRGAAAELLGTDIKVLRTALLRRGAEVDSEVVGEMAGVQFAATIPP